MPPKKKAITDNVRQGRQRRLGRQRSIQDTLIDSSDSDNTTELQPDPEALDAEIRRHQAHYAAERRAIRALGDTPIHRFTLAIQKTAAVVSGTIEDLADAVRTDLPRGERRAEWMQRGIETANLERILLCCFSITVTTTSSSCNYRK